MALKAVLIILVVALIEGGRAAAERVMDVAASMNNTRMLQAALQVLQTISLTSWRYPSTCAVTNGSTFDFIIVGGGSAGSVLTSRLTENNSTSVLLLEAGGYPPIEADDFPGLCTLLSQSVYDYNYYAQNDNYSAQNLKNGGIGLTAGMTLGGTGSLQDMLYNRGAPHDYNNWAELLGDASWSYANVTRYFKKQEHVVNKELRESSDFKDFGTNGTLYLKWYPNPNNYKYLAAFKELGHNIVNVTTEVGYGEPIFNIDDGVRHSSALRYLGLAKSRPNLCMSLFTTATKVLIKNNTAVGVQVTMSNGDTYIFYANKEVVVSAGAINSPKLLMLSGIGPKSHLESFGIEVQADLPVGQNFQDPAPAVIVYQMENSTAPSTSVNSHEFTLPTFLGQVALNSSQPYADYQSVNFEISHDSSSLLQICSNMFKYTDEICQKLFDANKNRTLLFVAIALLMPESKGQVLLASKNSSDAPLIYPNTFNNTSDLTLLAKYLEDYHKVINTTYFKSVNASLVDLNLCPNSETNEEFWQCYALKMSTTYWHYIGTCAMGPVLDSHMRVQNVSSLRVVDASAIPKLIRGKIFPVVNMMAEYAADMIRSAWNIPF